MSDKAAATGPTFADVNRDVIKTLAFPGNMYFGWMCIVGLILTAGILAWSYQIWAVHATIPAARMRATTPIQPK